MHFLVRIVDHLNEIMVREFKFKKRTQIYRCLKPFSDMMVQMTDLQFIKKLKLRIL